jgi:hypothetical protein
VPRSTEKSGKNQRAPASQTVMTRCKAHCPIPELGQRRLPARFNSKSSGFHQRPSPLFMALGGTE